MEGNVKEVKEKAEEYQEFAENEHQVSGHSILEG